MQKAKLKQEASNLTIKTILQQDDQEEEEHLNEENIIYNKLSDNLMNAIALDANMEPNL